MRLALTILATLLTLAGPVAAQSWTGTATGEGATRFGTVLDTGRNLFLSCNTPPPGGGTRHIDGNNAFPVNNPFSLTVELADSLVPMSGPANIMNNVAFWIDETGYRLPPMEANQVYGVWQAELPMADPMIQALYAAQSLILDTGTGQAWSFPADGLEGGLDIALGACVDGWAQWGQTIPVALNRYWPVVDEGPAEPVAGAIPAEVDAHIRRGCGSGYELRASDLGGTDFDRDGQIDLILDWGAVTCFGAMARPFCGAAYCSVDVFLSSRPGQRPVGFLGVGYSLPLARNGVQGIRFGGTAGACNRGECDDVFWWDGTQFQRQP